MPRELGLYVVAVDLDPQANLTAARIVLVDVGQNLGAINRAVMVASDHVGISSASDLYFLAGTAEPGPDAHGLAG